MKNNDPIFWPGTEVDSDMKRQMDSNYNDAINILQTQWAQADIDQRFFLGDQDLWGTIFPDINFRRKMWNFNLIHSMVEVVSGYQRRNRKATICIPRAPQMQQTADQFTKCLYYVHDKNHGYHVYSDAFEQGALVQGIGLISFYLDPLEDPSSPEIKMRYVDFKSIICDPFFRKSDLSDCRFIWTRQFFDREELTRLYPEFTDEIMNMPMGGGKNDKFYYMPEMYQIQFPNLVAFDEYWYLSTRKCRQIVDMYTNESQEFMGDEEDMRLLQMQFGKERFKIITREKPTVRRCLLVNDKVIVDEENPYGIDKYPYVPTLGYFSPDTPYYAYKFKGMVRDMRDAQYLFNRRKVADLDIIESQQQGWKIKKGVLVTPDDAFNTGAGRALFIDKNAQMSDVEPMPIIPPAPALIEMEERLKTVMMQISGVNEEMMGSAIDDKAGILSVMRQGAGVTTMQRLFDQLDIAQTMCGEIIIGLIQKNWSYNKVKQVIGEEPSPEFDNKAFFNYGCKVVQGALTETQQQLELVQLFELQQRFGDIFPPEEIIEAMTIQNKDRIVEKMMQNQQAQQQQQQAMQQLQMQQMQVDNETKIAYAQSQMGLAQERIAKIDTDKAVAEDKLRRAEEEDTRSLLNLVKSIKELENMDITSLAQKVSLLEQLNALDFTEKMQQEQTPGANL